ncbi:hypothetical protein [Devosia marina]|uniref:Uncharacterized protein n=1 Tax=Devosia marina TaxID=2683198 RepID=A0A7X3FPP8_9HYPH|nr:hypothetical protein [Devosia marina]MVS98486.1 hypothetical protein [Devosia marina]
MTDLGLWIDTGCTNLVADNVGDGATALTGVTSSPCLRTAWDNHDHELVECIFGPYDLRCLILAKKSVTGARSATVTRNFAVRSAFDL